MEKITASGRTVEEAIESALQQLGASRDKVNINIVEQPGKRLFGLMGKKDAVVQVELISDPFESEKDQVPLKKAPANNQLAEAKSFLNDVFDSMGLTVQIEKLSSKEQVLFNLIGRDLGVLIGRRGQTLDALQYLTNIVANKHTKDERVRIVLDAENYRAKRKVTLERLAVKLADGVIRTGKEVVLEPMTPLERKIIHTQLQDHPKIQTFSIDEEPNRKVVISLKRN